MNKVLVIGEILCDFIRKNKIDSFERKLGGAPLNVASNLANLEVDTVFVGTIGNDLNGQFIEKNLKKIKNKYLDFKISKINSSTTIAFVEYDKNNTNFFSFCRDLETDTKFNYEEINNVLESNSISLLHLGSLFLSSEEARDNIKKILEKAKQKSIKVSFDINFRNIFSNNENYFDYYKELFSFVDIIKFTKEEFDMITKKLDLSNLLRNRVVFITDGKNPSKCFYKNLSFSISTQKVDNIKDSVGCGDSFFSGILSVLYDKDINKIDSNILIRALKRGNYCGALTLQTRGATNSYKLEDIKKVETMSIN